LRVLKTLQPAAVSAHCRVESLVHSRDVVGADEARCEVEGPVDVSLIIVLYQLHT